MHLHPHMHAEIARDTQSRRIAEARAANAAHRRREVAGSEPAGRARGWMPFLKSLLTDAPGRQSA